MRFDRVFCGLAAAFVGAVPLAAEEATAGCSRDWKAFAESLSGDPRGPAERLSELGAAWIEEYVCARRKALLGGACEEAAAGAPSKDLRKRLKKGCGELEDDLEAAQDRLEPAIEEARKQEEGLVEAGLPGSAAELGDGWWARAGSPEDFGRGLERLVHWYHRGAGANLDAALRDYAAVKKSLAKVEQDLSDAYQLGLSKEEQKAKKSERKELEAQLDAREKPIKAERRRFQKEGGSILDRWAKEVRKGLKAARSSKGLCDCAPASP